MALALPGALGAQAASDALRKDIDYARSKVYPALVNLSVVAQGYAGGRAQRFPAAGSGVIVSAAGHIITNFHVAGHTTRITCTLPSGERILADVVAHDPLTDLSVLKLRLETRENIEPLPFATLGDSDALIVGDYVLAMGNPLTLSSSLTLGVVSNPRRVFTDFTGTEISDLDLGEGEKTGIFTRWIQHDALILPGNSGGPLVNLRGEVVGINELGGGGVGFAIPSNLTARVLSQVMAYGEVRRGWLGVTILPVSKLGQDEGALISAVQPSSPASEAGLEAGDILLALGGQPVNVRFFEEVPLVYQRVAELRAGTQVELRYRRAGQPEVQHARATITRMERYLGDEEEVRDLGVTLREITGPMALARRYPTHEGVLVTGIRPGLPFEEARPQLLGGDIIVSLAGRPTSDLKAFGELYVELREAAASEVAVAFWRRDQSLVTTVDISKKDDKPRGGELPKPWMGLRNQVMTPGVAKALGLEGTRGFRITEVFPWTRAQAAGLRIGDVIVALEGEPLEAFRPQDAQDLRVAIEDHSIGDEVVLTVLRAGERLSIAVELEETPAPSLTAKKKEQEDFEFTVRELTFMDRIEHKLAPEEPGLLVVDVVNGGWASIAGLRIDDVILRLEGQPVGTVAEFEKVIEGLIELRPAVVQLFVRRGHTTHFVFIEPVWKDRTG